MNFLDKTQKYTIEFDEDTQSWVCVSEDLQKEGRFGIGGLSIMDQDLAAGLAMMECAGYDAEILCKELIK